MAANSALETAREISFGSVAGIAGKFFEYPFDTIKVRLQSQPDDRPLKFKGPIDCFRQTISHEGILGLYRGISSPLVGAAAENASLFWSYKMSQFFLRSFGLIASQELPLGALILCGAISGAFTSFILTPIELIKCKMQVQNLVVASPGEKMPGATGLILQVYRDTGLTGFWRGQLGTLFRETGGSAAWFGSYEYVSGLFRKQDPNRTSNSASESMIAGAIAGIAYNISLFPADSIKSRMQTESLLGTGESKGFWEIGRSMYKSGGIAVLYRGCGMTVMRSAPSSAIIFVTYEQLKVWSS
ncbi:mitochondrial carrier domain-containing protein [Dipodascopsis uninucleata]